ncbi:hypothetical protein [Mitsuaria sp. GD03876]|uniref:hypothetical protein n=1 Tax=Mitsuaria sp. GD03876 TaxID=2975399 RepID=UPI00244824CD|nr:hypothetical protein [Mitsuaria sp. GD03876]MDH0867583.1 hypothetical protein [Mitsuaria sp. GD03876]
MRTERGRVDWKIAAALALVGAVLGWLAIGGPGRTWDAAATLQAGSPPASAPRLVRDGPAAAASGPASDALGSAVPASAAVEVAAAPASTPSADVPAAWSLSDARTAGDDRAPPVRRQSAEEGTPAWQLDDRQAYARREQDRHQAAQQAFVAAADKELPLIDQQIERGRAMGLSPEQLAKGEEKRRRIAEMRARMQAELAASGAAP